MAQLNTVKLVVWEKASDDDADNADGVCTPKQQAFAGHWAETGNKAAAYRMAYDVHPRTAPMTIWNNAQRVAALPKVQAFYKKLHDAALMDTILSIREIYQINADIATADPNEIVSVQERCCRYCHGVDNEYQWRDVQEWADEVAKALDAGKKTTPDDKGGFGFYGIAPPNSMCTHCFGLGERTVHIADTTKLTRKARRLYAGAKQDRHGVIEVKLHDQDKAREMCAKMIGALPELAKMGKPEDAPLLENVTEDQASKAYLALVGR